VPGDELLFAGEVGAGAPHPVSHNAMARHAAALLKKNRDIEITPVG
jgi:hypothetical protein